MKLGSENSNGADATPAQTGPGMPTCLGLAISLALFLPIVVQGATCLYDNTKNHLPTHVGNPRAYGIATHLLPCDTMVVPSGQTTTIHAGTWLHFGEASSPNHVILVKGTLITEGTAEKPVTFSGTLAEGLTGTVPGGSLWGGILVAEGGKVRLQGTRIHNASSALISNSTDVAFSQAFFKGCLNLLPPNQQSILLDYEGEVRDTLDFFNMGAKSLGYAGRGPKERKNRRQGSQLQERSSSKPWLWVALGATALLAGGGITYHVLYRPEKSSIGEDPLFAPDPEFPSVEPR